ncbi:hypothetical protein A6R68_17597, partial [Neotoma lepida]
MESLWNLALSAEAGQDPPPCAKTGPGVPLGSKKPTPALGTDPHILPDYRSTIASPGASGVPVINCRVCQSLINLDGKLHQHVVKCTVCNEAT